MSERKDHVGTTACGEKRGFSTREELDEWWTGHTETCDRCYDYTMVTVRGTGPSHHLEPHNHDVQAAADYANKPPGERQYIPAKKKRGGKGPQFIW
ncbi:hypothetical protein IPM62_01850 [Candidatus Woesebacteria bacterium]|nr:MAG: hypothetical protein IPM62_01850 [Candidatus Woesebacteria bacterium]